MVMRGGEIEESVPPPDGCAGELHFFREMGEGVKAFLQISQKSFGKKMIFFRLAIDSRLSFAIFCAWPTPPPPPPRRQTRASQSHSPSKEHPPLRRLPLLWARLPMVTPIRSSFLLR